MLKIQIPDNNIPERKYILHIFFSEFLVTDYEVEIQNIDSYKLLFRNNVIEIEDAFFNNFPNDLSYLKEENIPGTVIFAKNRFILEADIPVIFGDETLTVSENGIYCGIDVFASSFFMLTRWEEHVIKEKDKHGRVPDELQFSVKQNFYQRPVVNEYVEMLRNMFAYFGLKTENRHEYTPVITHDVDFFARYDKFSKVLKALTGDIIKRKSFKKAKNTLQTYFNIRKGRELDPYNTFDYLMNLSESIGQKSHFYFIPTLSGEEDAQYSITDTAVVKTMQKIFDRGHIVGVHGAYRSYKKKNLFLQELRRFPGNLQFEEVRQHFLRFKNPETWQIHEDVGIKFDGTIGFMNHIGFRAGTCFEYSVFNILTRKKLNLKEQPLICMEQALMKEFSGKEEFFDKFAVLKKIIKKYKGNFVILWHNSNFNISEWKPYKDVYEKIISEIN